MFVTNFKSIFFQLTFADIAVYTMLSFLMWEEEKGFQNVNAEDRFLIMVIHTIMLVFFIVSAA